MTSYISRALRNTIPRVIHRVCGNIVKAGYSLRLLIPVLVSVLVLALSGCASQPPKAINNICDIFSEKKDWHRAAKRAEAKWGAPLQVPMAMMYQESKFRQKARPPKRYLLGVIPMGRKSSAYGYSQAKTATWRDYQKETGNRWADRDDFSDAIDFMAWFIYKTHKVNKVSKWDANKQYLNYHEGWGGYRRGTYKKKQWLIGVAGQVGQRASTYGQQYRGCKKRLSQGWLRRILPW